MFSDISFPQCGQWICFESITFLPFRCFLPRQHESAEAVNVDERR